MSLSSSLSFPILLRLNATTAPAAITTISIASAATYISLLGPAVGVTVLVDDVLVMLAIGVS